MSELDNKLKFFADYIESQLGIVYVEANYFQLEHRLKDIATQIGMSSIDELYNKARVSIDGMMKSLILDLATNNETSFFRDPAIYKALSECVIPDLIKASKSKISIWSAASSSGQEAYSIAMEVAGMRAKDPSLPPLEMLVSDVSDTILNRAKNGVYSQLEVQRGLSAKLMVQNFDKVDEDKWKVKPELQKGMEFKKLNLLSTWGFIGPFDVIFVRNVLIYQNVENKKKVINAMLEKLNPGGYLFLGAAESLFGISDKFTQISHNGAVIYKKI